LHVDYFEYKKIHEKSEQQIVRGSFTALGTHCSQQISHKFNLHTFHLSGDFGSNLTIINAEPQELFGLHQEVAGISAGFPHTPSGWVRGTVVLFFVQLVNPPQV